MAQNSLNNYTNRYEQISMPSWTFHPKIQIKLVQKVADPLKIWPKKPVLVKLKPPPLVVNNLPVLNIKLVQIQMLPFRVTPLLAEAPTIKHSSTDIKPAIDEFLRSTQFNFHRYFNNLLDH
jgi:hypothetical protein